MTLNGVMAVTLRYFNEFGKRGKRAFQLITASSSIELIDQESTSPMHPNCEHKNNRKPSQASKNNGKVNLVKLTR